MISGAEKSLDIQINVGTQMISSVIVQASDCGTYIVISQES
jgi:hypothetical protein